MCLKKWGGGGGGAGGEEAQEIRGQKAGEEKVGSRSSKRAGSREKCENAKYFNLQCVTILSKTSTQIIFHLHVTSFQSLLRLLSKRANEQTKFALGLKNRLTSGETVH